MTEAVPNMPLLDAAVAHIKANPAEWNQANWRCESGGCLAYHLAALSGAEWLMDSRRDKNVLGLALPACAAGYGLCCCTEYSYHDVVTPDGRILPVRAFAAEVAGLDEDEAMVLFGASNRLHRLEALVEGLRIKASRAHSIRQADAAPSPSCGTPSTNPARELGRWGLVLAE